MATKTLFLSQFSRGCLFLSQRCLSSMSEALPQSTERPRIQTFRTIENNPANHTTEHLGKFYTIPPSIVQHLFQHEGLPKDMKEQAKTFNELCVMVRNPALEILHYLRTADYSRPAVRYVIFGKRGAGKSLTLTHLLHYAFVSEFVIVHVPFVRNWTFDGAREVANSATKEGYLDLPILAAEWLIHFKAQNITLLTKLQLRLTQDYVWSQREVTSKDAPLIELVELGINRVKYASDCIVALLKELKIHSTEGRCKTFVAINGYNAFFHPKTRLRNDEKVYIHPHKISFTEGFLDITKFDWCNGAIVLVVDEVAVGYWNHNESEYPYYQLYKEGFEHLDPFIPIHVPHYTTMEVENCLAYYEDRKWLQRPAACTEQGRQELIFLSDKNPYTLMRLCAPL